MEVGNGRGMPGPRVLRPMKQAVERSRSAASQWRGILLHTTITFPPPAFIEAQIGIDARPTNGRPENRVFRPAPRDITNLSSNSPLQCGGTPCTAGRRGIIYTDAACRSTQSASLLANRHKCVQNNENVVPATGRKGRQGPSCELGSIVRWLERSGTNVREQRPERRETNCGRRSSPPWGSVSR